MWEDPGKNTPVALLEKSNLGPEPDGSISSTVGDDILLASRSSTRVAALASLITLMERTYSFEDCQYRYSNIITLKVSILLCSLRGSQFILVPWSCTVFFSALEAFNMLGLAKKLAELQ